MIDTSVLVAGLVANHEFHDLARPHVERATDGVIPGIVAAESWAALRRAPWHLDPGTVERVLAPWSSTDRIAGTPADAYVDVLRTGASLNLGGGVHDLLIALTCAAHDLPLATLDRRQATIARTIPGLQIELVLPET